MVLMFFSELELNVFENEEFASNTRHEGIAISALISGTDDDAKLDVSYLRNSFSLPVNYRRLTHVVGGQITTY